jgi:hypothetical protein
MRSRARQAQEEEGRSPPASRNFASRLRTSKQRSCVRQSQRQAAKKNTAHLWARRVENLKTLVPRQD